MPTWSSSRRGIRQRLATAALIMGLALAGCAHAPGAPSPAVAPSQAMSGPPARVVQHYFQYLEHSEFDAARALWRADALDTPSRTRLQQTYAGLARLRSSIIGRTAYDETAQGLRATVHFRIIEYRMLAQQPQTYNGTCQLRAPLTDTDDAPRRWQIERLDWNGAGPRILRSL